MVLASLVTYESWLGRERELGDPRDSGPPVAEGSGGRAVAQL